MIKNYLKVAWRNLLRNKGYSAINIGGLAIGMAVALLIGLWVSNELNTNKNFAHYDQIVRVMQNQTNGGHTQTVPVVPVPLVEKLRKDYGSDFKSVAMITWNGGHVLAYGDTKLGTEGSRYVQPALLDILAPHWIEGGHNALNDPATIVLGRAMATALFGKTDPLGKVIRVDNQHDERVTGVYEDFPPGSEFDNLRYMISWAQLEAEWAPLKQIQDDWGSNSMEIIAQVQDNTDLAKLSAKIRPILQDMDPGSHRELFLYPMRNWHLYNEFKDGKNTGGEIEFVRMFGWIGLFVLLLACINFMNLSTARSQRRAREVGIRKSLGSQRGHLIGQFLGESLLTTCLAFILSLLLVWLSLPWFSRVAGRPISFPWTSPMLWVSIAGITIFTGLLAGSYPSLYLSSFRAVQVLKGGLKAGRTASLPRKILVVLQFTVSVALIIGTAVVSQEIHYVHDRPMGYDNIGLLTFFRGTPELMKNYDAMYNDLKASGAIQDMSLSGNPTLGLFSSGNGYDWPGRDPNFNPNLGGVTVSQNFGKTVGWQFVAGRDFSSAFKTDSMGVILNETAVKLMGLKKPVGTTIGVIGDPSAQGLHVIGVIKDMIMESPFDPVRPTIYTMNSRASDLYWITLKLNPVLPMSQAISKIAPIFKAYNPNGAFDYWVNEDKYAQHFVLENRIDTLTKVFGVFAILISCLGLFGLASFTAEQRTREIGVRKVLGASVPQLWALLSKEFVLLVTISILIALPISYYYMSHWLQRYDYRTSISAWILLAAVAGAFLITLVTVSFQSIKASLANPVKSLREE